MVSSSVFGLCPDRRPDHGHKLCRRPGANRIQAYRNAYATFKSPALLGRDGIKLNPALFDILATVRAGHVSWSCLAMVNIFENVLQALQTNSYCGMSHLD